MHETAVRMRLFREDSANIVSSVIEAFAFANIFLHFRCGFIMKYDFQAFHWDSIFVWVIFGIFAGVVFRSISL